MKIAILGTKGIPNHYGGFEQFAQYLSIGLVNLGHDLTVYSPHFHRYQEKSFQNVKIKHIYCPEKYFGGAAHFIYDFLCLRDALKSDFDIIYEAGYATCAHAIKYMPRKATRPLIVINMDGMEWRRSKWNKFAQKITKYAEAVAVDVSNYVIADNVGIQSYFKKTYGIDAVYLPYGADPIADYDISVLPRYGLIEKQFFILIARLEPENNVEMIIQGYIESKTEMPLIIIGGLNTKHAKELLKYADVSKNIRFLGGIYNLHDLNALRHYSKGYFHGHSVGGTNPSLLEAMACESIIIAHQNEFNCSVTSGNAFFFSSANDIARLISRFDDALAGEGKDFASRNKELIRNHYNWNHIIQLHLEFFESIVSERKRANG